MEKTDVMTFAEMIHLRDLKIDTVQVSFAGASNVSTIDRPCFFNHTEMKDEFLLGIDDNVKQKIFRILSDMLDGIEDWRTDYGGFGTIRADIPSGKVTIEATYYTQYNGANSLADRYYKDFIRQIKTE